jgi:hypothetical protein
MAGSAPFVSLSSAVKQRLPNHFPEAGFAAIVLRSELDVILPGRFDPGL